MSFLLDETSQQKGVSQFLRNRFLICETTVCINLNPEIKIFSVEKFLIY